MAGRVTHYGNTVRDGLVLHLDAAKKESYAGSGTTWRDLSGNGNDGRLVNGVGFNSNFNGSMTFDGTNDVCFVDTLSNYNFNSGLTAIVAHYNVGGQYRGLFGNGYATAGTFEMRYGRENFFTGQSDNGTRLNCNIVNTSNVGTALTINAELNVWGIFALTYNGSTLSVFKNGALFNSTDVSITLKTSQYPIAVGAAVWQTAGTDSVRELLIGSVPFVQLYNRALSATEVSQNFNALRGRYGI
jgi:hypothetical protein